MVPGIEIPSAKPSYHHFRNYAYYAYLSRCSFQLLFKCTQLVCHRLQLGSQHRLSLAIKAGLRCPVCRRNRLAGRCPILGIMFLIGRIRAAIANSRVSPSWPASAFKEVMIASTSLARASYGLPRLARTPSDRAVHLVAPLQQNAPLVQNLICICVFGSSRGTANQRVSLTYHLPQGL